MSPLKGRSGGAPGRLAAAVIFFPLVVFAACVDDARAQTGSVGDRYSGEPYANPAFQPNQQASGRTLSWPGKIVAAAPQPVAPLAGQYGDASRASTSRAATAYPSRASRAGGDSALAYQARDQPAYESHAQRYAAAPVTPWFQRYGAGRALSAPLAGAPPAAPPPQSIYDSPAEPSGAATGSAASAAATAPPTVSAASAAGPGETARFYSVHRQYGLTPDPDPIPPQFFSQTADLSEPPGPSPVYKATTASGGSTTAVHPVQSDDGASSLGQP
jgi:hypothetical protein